MKLINDLDWDLILDEWNNSRFQKNGEKRQLFDKERKHVGQGYKWRGGGRSNEVEWHKKFLWTEQNELVEIGPLIFSQDWVVSDYVMEARSSHPQFTVSWRIIYPKSEVLKWILVIGCLQIPWQSSTCSSRAI